MAGGILDLLNLLGAAAGGASEGIEAGQKLSESQQLMRIQRAREGREAEMFGLDRQARQNQLEMHPFEMDRARQGAEPLTPEEARVLGQDRGLPGPANGLNRERAFGMLPSLGNRQAKMDLEMLRQRGSARRAHARAQTALTIADARFRGDQLRSIKRDWGAWQRVAADFRSSDDQIAEAQEEMALLEEEAKQFQTKIADPALDRVSRGAGVEAKAGGYPDPATGAPAKPSEMTPQQKLEEARRLLRSSKR